MDSSKAARTALAAIAVLGFVVAPALPQDTPKVKGTVEKVDESAEKITVDHAPIPNLDMGEMKMVFKAGDKAMLKQVKKGDKVLFTADRVNGQLTITSIAKAK
jgi:Cu(I)/Ag(I) efflux system periplasmic protein CusF